LGLEPPRPGSGSARPKRKASASGPRRLWLLALPGIVLFAVVVLIPCALGVYYSFTDYSGIGGSHWIGWQNYQHVLHDEGARASIRNTLFLTAVVIVAQNVLGLLLALALHTYFRGRNMLRVVFFAPVVISPVIVGYIWQYIYSPTGALNIGLSSAGLSGLEHDWLGDANLALWAIAIVVVWQYTGYSMVLYSAGLEAISTEILEAAQIDGASAWQAFWRIRFPLLAPAFTISVALSLISGLKLFDQVVAMTNGGPGYATETLSTVIYKQAFTFGNLAYGSAIAVVLTAVVGVGTVIQVLVLRRREVVA
jgi:raffinose/stachyose/melibiose transport system permease protein